MKEKVFGKQIWMKNNLSVVNFCNGDPIPLALCEETWLDADLSCQPACCYINGNWPCAEDFGMFYNWYAVNDPRGLAPTGWRIPSVDEWNELFDFLGGKNVAGLKMKKNLCWDGQDYFTDKSGFDAFPYGFRGVDFNFIMVGYGCNFWSSTQKDSNTAYNLHLYDFDNSANICSSPKEYGFLVRCLR